MDDTALMFSERQSIRDSARPLRKYGSTSQNCLRSSECLVQHVVAETDTLQGIALKYGCTTEQLRRANRLFASDSLFLHQTLQVPVAKNSQFLPQADADLLFQTSDDAQFYNLQSSTPTKSHINYNNGSASTAASSSSCNTSSSSSSGSVSSASDNKNQRESLGSISNFTLTPDEENRKSINDFLNKIDNAISESRRYVERSREHSLASSRVYIDDDDNDMNIEQHEWSNNNYGSHKRQQTHNAADDKVNGRPALAAASPTTPPARHTPHQHQRQSSSGSACSDTTHLLSTTAHIKRYQSSIQRLEKEQDDFFEL